jgi:RNA 3'-terminal phosphate cyclase (ATP)
MLTIDGAMGEGGGQILRTALASSLLTGRPFRIERIRASRRKPGLLHQHLAAFEAAAMIAGADTTGGYLGSQTLVFEPGEVRPGTYSFVIGTAGSTGLLLETVLVPLLSTGGVSELVIEGGTHNEAAPPFEFLDLALAPLLRRMGAELTLTLERPGFYPGGGGRIRVETRGARWTPLHLPDRGPVHSIWARALVSALPISIAERELAVVRDELDRQPMELSAEAVEATGPGNALLVGVESEHITEVFSGFGRRGVLAEQVARTVVERVQQYLNSGVAVGLHLADQLLLPLTQSGGGAFLTLPPTEHFKTNLEVLTQFFDFEVRTRPVGDETVMIECATADKSHSHQG